MIVLGMGLGLVMQVLVLAAQNAVDYRHLGVASSGTILFRQIGGSIGVSVFGAVFANHLAAALASRLTAGSVPARATPDVIQRLPPEVRDIYLHAFTASLHPVFLVAAAIAVLGFVLSFRLPEQPLRSTSRASTAGEAIAAPREADSLAEITRALTVLGDRGQRWQVYETLAERAGMHLAPPELWLLARLGERPPPTVEGLAAELHVDAARVEDAASQLERDGLLLMSAGPVLELTAKGRDAYGRLVAARRASLETLLAGWKPEEHAELRTLLDRLAHAFTCEIPMPPDAQPRAQAAAGGA
jgi:DNA-binding MarR family transcriptional regulator